MIDNIKLSCSRVVGDRIVAKDHQLIELKKVLLIDNCKVKNETRLRVRTSDEDYIFNLAGPISVMEEMLQVFGFWRADNSNLINMNAVNEVKISLFAAEAVFNGKTGTRGIIAKHKVNVMRKLFPEIQIVKAL